MKIYNDIAAEEEKICYQWMGADAVCMKDVDEFLSAIGDDDTVDIRLHCSGGLVSEGWAIYDKLRASGKKITATVEGKCASMATVVLMAAPKEERKAMPSARILVHNPWMPSYAIGEAVTADDLRKAAEQMQAEQDRILDLYVERCGCDREAMQALMNEDKVISTDKAIEMGLISEVIAPISAKSKKPIINKSMDKVEVKKNWLERLLAKAGFAKMEEAVFAMELSTADGGTIEVEREEGEPQVGDKATPDGEHVMPDGSTIVVADGVITEIKPSEGTAKGAGGEEGEVEKLQKRIEELEAENEELKKQLEESQAKAKSKDDMAILNAVKMAGGREWLAKNCSTYKVQGRKVSGVNAQETVQKSAIREKIEAIKNKKQ